MFRRINYVRDQVSLPHRFIWRKPCADIQCIGGSGRWFEQSQARTRLVAAVHPTVSPVWHHVLDPGRLPLKRFYEHVERKYK